MKKLLVITFAISSLLRPSLVLCMETTGDVRVEYRESCCASQPSASSVAIDSAAANDCDGCLDVSLSTHSLAHKRALNEPTTASVGFVLPVATAAPSWAVLLSHTSSDSRSTLRSLSTTVIRR